MPEPLLRPIIRGWTEKIRKAHTWKENEFGRDADEAERFFDGPHDFMYSGKFATRTGMVTLGGEEGAPSPTFRMSVNKVAEMVQIFGPVLYHRNPHRDVTVRELPEFPIDLLGDPQQNPQLQQMLQSQQQGRRVKEVVSDLLESYLNYTPNELNLQWHSRMAIDECIIKGMGLLWQEVIRSPGSPYLMVGSFYDTVDNLLVDPDMESLTQAKWIARRRVIPVWEAESKFGLQRGTLKPTLESSNMQAEVAHPDYDYFRQRGDTNDLFTYWEIYSRMGMGHRLQSVFSKQMRINEDLLDQFGNNIFLAVSDDYNWPLNLPPEVLEQGDMMDVFRRVQWPTPFWADPACPWPFTALAFHERPRKVWPMSHVKPALGELKFMNWAMSFIADKVKNTSRDFVAVLKSLAEETRTAILSGRDLSLLEFEKINGSIQDNIQFLQHPPFNKDVMLVVQDLREAFDKRTGLNELMYGTTAKQLRSAAEAHGKMDQLNIRPDDMSSKVEEWMSQASRKEAICARWHLTGQDITPVMGPERAMLWEQLMGQTELYTLVHELDYRIEAGSVRKPNRSRDIENINNAIQVWGPVVQEYAGATGDFGPLNALAYHWSKAYDVDPGLIQFQPPPPPEPDQAAQQEAQLELEVKAAEHQQSMEQKQEQHQLKLEQLVQSDLLKQFQARAKLRQDDESHDQDLGQDEEKHGQDLTQDQQKHLQEMMQAREKGNLERFLEERMGLAKVETEKKRAAAKPKPAGNGA